MIIYDGNASTGTQLVRGQTGCSSATLTTGTDIVAESGTMTIEWHSDGSSTAAGWTATITGEAAAACPKPTSLLVNNITSSSATLTWNGGEATAWQICFNGDEGNLIDVDAATYTFNTLSPLTSYTVKVRTVCGGEQSDWTAVQNFSTTAVATAVGDSWSDDFEGSSCGWELVNGTLTNKWCWGTATHNGGTHALYISNDDGTTHAYTNSGSHKEFATKLLNFTDGKFEFSYDWIANGESTYDFLRVALVPASQTLTAGTDNTTIGTTTLPTGWIALDGGGKLNVVTAWQNKQVAINVTAGNYYLVMIWRQDNSGGSNPPAAIDNVSITKLACPYDVTGLDLDGAPTTTSATVTWTAGEATQWQVAYSTSSTFEGAATTTVSAATATLTGLTASSTYYVRVRAFCGGEDFGAWSDPFSFQTACEAIEALGYTENFDGLSVASASTAPSARVLPVCWSAINTTTYATYQPLPSAFYYSYTNYANSTPNCLKFYSYYSSYSNYDPQDQYAILPEMTGLAGKQVTLQARGYNATSTFYIGTMSDPTDAGTFVPFGGEQTLTTSYAEKIFLVPTDATGNHLAIMIEAASSSRTTNGVYIDDIAITNPPACPKPTSLAKVASTSENPNPTAHTVALTWTKGDEETAWVVAYKTSEATDFTEVPATGATAEGTTVSFTLTGLDAETAYTIKVKADCGDATSEYSNTVTATTTIACPAPTGVAASDVTNHEATISWNGTSSDGYTVSYRTAAYAIGLGENFGTSLPTGWSNMTGLVDNVIAGSATLTSGSQWVFGTNNGVFDNHARINIYGTSRYGWLISPEFTVPAGAEFSFDLALTAYSGTGAASGTCVDDRFAVLIFADNAWTILREWNNEAGAEYVYNNIPTAGTTVDDIDVSAYEGKTVKIAFYGESTESGGDNNLHIDNVMFGNSVEAGNWQTTDVSDSPATLTGLLAERKYEVKVQGNCGDLDGLSLETTPITFTTAIACPAPTGFNTSEVKSDRVTLNWSSLAEDWEIMMNDEEGNLISLSRSDVTPDDEVENLYHYTLDGLESNSRYVLRVRNVCGGEDGESAWTDEEEVTTLEPCSIDNVVASNESYHSVNLTWDGESEEFAVKYRTAAYFGGVDEEFSTSIPTGWSNMTGLVDNVIAGSATLTSGSQWAFGTNNGVFDNHARINIYGSGSSERKGWLISPEFTVPAGAEFSFDLALTAYSGTGAASTDCADDRFAVLIFADNAWTILREWNNEAGAEYVYNNIPTAGTTVDDIDVSAYEGKTVKIAFYGESTVSGGDNNLHIDNVLFGADIDAGAWQGENDEFVTDQNSYTLEDLEPGTDYDVVVVAKCNDIESTPATFTTLALPTMTIQAGKWYAIASPMHDNGHTYESVDNVENLTDGTYDFLRWNEGANKWESQKSAAGHTGFTTMEQGRGYVYRRSTDATLKIDGEVNTGNVTIPITATVNGWNLVGNPYLTSVKLNTNVDPSTTATFAASNAYYKLNTNGTWTSFTSSTAIAAGQAVIVKATAAGNLVLREAAPTKGVESSDDEQALNIAFVVRNDEFEDVAYALFEDGDGLPKISHLNAEAPMLSIAMADDNYAIAMVGNAEQFPLHFSGQGNYTLTVKGNTDVTGYLHLLDRATGLDIDLLSTPEYTFTATAAGDRFLVKLTPDANGFDFGGFARVSGSQLTVDGQGELQVFDVMGRQLGSAQVDGTTTLDGRSLGIQSSGVYVLRLGGESQKIVVK